MTPVRSLKACVAILLAGSAFALGATPAVAAPAAPGASAAPAVPGAPAPSYRLGAGRPLPTRIGACVLRPRAHCAGANLSGDELFHANLAHADLRRAHLRGANLTGAELRDARLSGALLSPAPKAGSPVGLGQPTILQLADLRGAWLVKADLERVVATGADLRKARLEGAHLVDADLANADLRGVSLAHADLHGADLHHATLVGADLRDADLEQARLQGADLRGARLRGADLLRSELAGAVLTRRQLRAARALCETTSTNGRPANRDCSRLGVTPHVTVASRLHRHADPTLPKRRARRVLVPAGPRLAAPRHGARASSNQCRPGRYPVCAWWYLAFDQFPGVEAVLCDCYSTDFDWANLEHSNFEGSFIALAQFDGANLTDANFSHTTSGLEPYTDTAINFNYANLEGVDLEGADLRGAQFMGANLHNANLRNTNLDVANFFKADLDGANLEGAYMEGTQLDDASVQEANLQGSFAVDANFANSNFTNSLLGVYMQEAPSGGFSGQQGSLNFDQAGWTCGTTLPSGTNDSDDCTWTFHLFGELLAGVAESVSGFSFGTVSSSALSAGIKAALEDTTESVGGTAIKLVNWAIFEKSGSTLSEILDSSPTVGTLQAQVVPVVTTIGVKMAKLVWELKAPEIDLTVQKVTEYLTNHPSHENIETVFSPVSVWEAEWANSLYAWWGTKPEGAGYAVVAGCEGGVEGSYKPPQCEATTFPMRVPNAPSASIAPPSPEEAAEAAGSVCYVCFL